MADEVCVAKRTDGSRCPRKARAFSNYCDEHEPRKISSQSKFVLYDSASYLTSPGRNAGADLDLESLQTFVEGLFKRK